MRIDKLLLSLSDEVNEDDNFDWYDDADAINKDEVLNPYPNEHSARLRDPDDFDPDSYRRTHGGTMYGTKKVPETIDIIWGKLKGKAKPSDPPLPQALRFPIKNWTAVEAKKWLKDNEVKYIKFEEATDDEESRAETYECECIECGHEMTSNEHCNNLECPECGGQMRRKGRPGPGQDSTKTKLKNRMPKKWWNVDGGGEDTVDVYIYDEIGWETSEFVKAVGKIKANNIRLRMNTPGGSVFDGHAIYNTLKMHKAHVEVMVEGLAASAGSLIAMAGDKITMAKNAFMMIHNPYMFTIGDANDLRKDAELLDKIRKTMVDTYAARTGNLKREIRKMLDEETWFDAEEAKESGFADAIIEEENKVAARNSFDLSSYRNVPLNLLRKTKKKKPTEREAEKVLRDAGFSRRDAKSILSGGFDKLRDAEDKDILELVKKRGVF